MRVPVMHLRPNTSLMILNEEVVILLSLRPVHNSLVLVTDSLLLEWPKQMTLLLAKHRASEHTALKLIPNIPFQLLVAKARN